MPLRLPPVRRLPVRHLLAGLALVPALLSPVAARTVPGGPPAARFDLQATAVASA